MSPKTPGDPSEQTNIISTLKSRRRGFDAQEWGQDKIDKANEQARKAGDPFIRYARQGFKPQEAANTLWSEELVVAGYTPPLLVAMRAYHGTFIVRTPFPYLSDNIYNLYEYFNLPPSEQSLFFYTKIAPKAVEIAQRFSFETTRNREGDIPLIIFIWQSNPPYAEWFTPPLADTELTL